MKTLSRTHPAYRLIPIFFTLVAFGLATAQEGLEIGLGAYPFDGVANVHATLPLFKANDVQHAARADVAYAFEGLPGVSATYLLRDAAGDVLASYLGAGFGVAFPEAPARSPALSAHTLIGANVPITGRFGAFTEAVIAGNAFDTSLSLGVGVTYTFGGSN